MEEDRTTSKPKTGPKFGNSLMKKPAGLISLSNDQEEEEKVPVAPVISSTKGDDPNNFANENVMSKSNLRQPKSFNFGFPAGGSSSSEEEEEL
jgi:hypothetical protein